MTGTSTLAWALSIGATLQAGGPNHSRCVWPESFLKHPSKNQADRIREVNAPHASEVPPPDSGLVAFYPDHAPNAPEVDQSVRRTFWKPGGLATPGFVPAKLIKQVGGIGIYHGSDPSLITALIGYPMPVEEQALIPSELMRAGKWREAQKKLEATVAIHPDFLQTREMLADTYSAQNNPRAAKKILSEAPAVTSHGNEEFWVRASLAAAMHGDVYEGQNMYTFYLSREGQYGEAGDLGGLPAISDAKGISTLSALLLAGHALCSNSFPSVACVYSRLALKLRPGDPLATWTYILALEERNGPDPQRVDWAEIARVCMAATWRGELSPEWNQFFESELAACAAHAKSSTPQSAPRGPQ